MRRFEFIQGNAQRFWEIERKGEVLYTRTGKIGTEGQTRNKQFDDFMEAEQEYDRAIRDRIRKGWTEVDEASVPLVQDDRRRLQLQPLDGSEPVVLEPDQTRYLVWRMVEIGIMDRHVPPPDLSRWRHRAARRLRLEAAPGPEHPQFGEWFEEWKRMSHRERAQSFQTHMIGAYKFLDDGLWVVNAEEADLIATEVEGRKPKRHRPTTRQQGWTDDWIALHLRMVTAGGYEIMPLE